MKLWKKSCVWLKRKTMRCVEEWGKSTKLQQIDTNTFFFRFDLHQIFHFVFGVLFFRPLWWKKERNERKKRRKWRRTMTQHWILSSFLLHVCKLKIIIITDVWFCHIQKLKNALLLLLLFAFSRWLFLKMFFPPLSFCCFFSSFYRDFPIPLHFFRSSDARRSSVCYVFIDPLVCDSKNNTWRTFSDL